MVNDHLITRENHKLLLIRSKGSFICIIPETGQYIPQPLLHQLWRTINNRSSDPQDHMCSTMELRLVPQYFKLQTIFQLRSKYAILDICVG